jgi:hypothetical protein
LHLGSGATAGGLEREPDREQPLDDGVVEIAGDSLAVGDELELLDVAPSGTNTAVPTPACTSSSGTRGSARTSATNSHRPLRATCATIESADPPATIDVAPSPAAVATANDPSESGTHAAASVASTIARTLATSKSMSSSSGRCSSAARLRSLTASTRVRA